MKFRVQRPAQSDLRVFGGGRETHRDRRSLVPRSEPGRNGHGCSMKTIAVWCTLWTGLAVRGQAADFVNLDLNNPDLSHGVYNPVTGDTRVPPQDALRSWSMQWDWPGTPEPLPTLVGTKYGGDPFGLRSGPSAYFGAYELSVQDYWGAYEASSLRPTFHLYQSGLVPEGASTLNFYVSIFGDPMELYINGTLQPYSWPSYYRTVAVSAFAGQEVKLEFVFPGGMFRNYSFDIYGFVPEPSTWALLGVGGPALWFVARRR